MLRDYGNRDINDPEPSKAALGFVLGQSEIAQQTKVAAEHRHH